MPAASGWITSRLRSSLWIFRMVSRRCLRFISCQWWLVALLFFSCGLAFMLTFLHSNSTWPGPVGENYSNSPAGSGRSPFQDNACHHLYNRQHRSHAPTRAATLQSKSGLSCRARLCLGFYLGHTITGELSKGVSGSYNHRKAVACAPTKNRITRQTAKYDISPNRDVLEPSSYGSDSLTKRKRKWTHGYFLHFQKTVSNVV